MSGWLPIETAPRDGTTVLLWAAGWRNPLTGWTYGADDWQDLRAAGSPPTHWQPLPPPPEEGT